MDEEIKNQDESITDAEISEMEGVKEENKIPARKKRSDFIIELALFFVLGILIGIAVKTEASKRVTMGFNDYKMKIVSQDYNINQIQTELLKKSADVSSQEEAAPAPEGNTEGASGTVEGNVPQEGNALPDANN